MDYKKKFNALFPSTPIAEEVKATPEEYEYNGKSLTELLKQKMKDIKINEDDTFIDSFVSNVAGYLEKPVILTSTIYHKDRMLSLRQHHSDLYHYLYYSRNSERNLPIITGYVEVLFPGKYSEFVTACQDVERSLRKAIANHDDETVKDCTRKATELIRAWCIEFTAPQ
jgi:hypothetical protein